MFLVDLIIVHVSLQVSVRKRKKSNAATLGVLTKTKKVEHITFLNLLYFRSFFFMISLIISFINGISVLLILSVLMLNVKQFELVVFVKCAI